VDLKSRAIHLAFVTCISGWIPSGRCKPRRSSSTAFTESGRKSAPKRQAGESDAPAGGRIVAVGIYAVRVLESAAKLALAAVRAMRSLPSLLWLADGERVHRRDGPFHPARTPFQRVDA